MTSAATSLWMDPIIGNKSGQTCIEVRFEGRVNWTLERVSPVVDRHVGNAHSAAMTNFCTHCGHSITNGMCLGCNPQGSPGPNTALDWVTATGRSRMAGVVLAAGGGALVLSSFLPWVSALGVVQARPAGSAVLVLLLAGTGTAFLGSLVLRSRASRAIRATLWTLSAIEALLVLLFSEALHAANEASIGGIVSVSSVVRPAIGLYLAVVAVITTVVGTVLLQMSKAAGRAQRDVPVPVRSVPVVASGSEAVPTGAGSARTSSPGSGVWWDGSQLRRRDDRGGLL